MWEYTVIEVEGDITRPEKIEKNGAIAGVMFGYCPLCQEGIKSFNLHLDTKIIMCENLDCDYPFGHATVKFIRTKTAYEPLLTDGDLRRMMRRFFKIVTNKENSIEETKQRKPKKKDGKKNKKWFGSVKNVTENINDNQTVGNEANVHTQLNANEVPTVTVMVNNAEKKKRKKRKSKKY